MTHIKGVGTIYLIHFAQPLGTGEQQARHYLGYTSRELEERLEEHRGGYGARLMAAVVRAGIAFEVVRTWVGDEVLEQRLKNLGGGARLCPTCSPGTRQGNFNHVPHESRWVKTKGKKRRYLMKVRTRAA